MALNFLTKQPSQVVDRKQETDEEDDLPTLTFNSPQVEDVDFSTPPNTVKSPVAGPSQPAGASHGKKKRGRVGRPSLKVEEILPDASIDLNGGAYGAPTTKGREVPQTAEELDALLDQAKVPRTGSQRAGEFKLAADGRRHKPTAEDIEFRRKQVLRLMLNGVPTKTIAAHLALTVRQVHEDRMALQFAMREELRNFDYPTYIGMSMALYDEVRTQSLRMAMDQKREGKVQVAALQVALRAEDAKHNFLTRVGLFKIAAPTDPFAAINTGRQGSYSDENDMNQFLQLIANSRTTKDAGPVDEVPPRGQ